MHQKLFLAIAFFYVSIPTTSTTEQADNFIDLAYRREQHAALPRHPPVICLTHFRKILIGQRHAHLHKPLSRQQHISRHYPDYLPCIPSLLEECPKSFHRVFEIRLYFRPSELLIDDLV